MADIKSMGWGLLFSRNFFTKYSYQINITNAEKQKECVKGARFTNLLLTANKFTIALMFSPCYSALRLIRTLSSFKEITLLDE